MLAEGEGAFFGLFLIFALMVILGIAAALGYVPMI